MASRLLNKEKMEVDSTKYDYDLIVIGGGSGGIACAREAAAVGAKVALFDFVKPTNHGTSWGLGGTCVNVGCIPKKIMHYSGLLGDSLFDAHKLGWDVPSDHKQCKFSWEKMSETVTNYIKSLNFKYKSSLLDADIHYFKAYATFIDPHTVQFKQRKKTDQKSAKYIILAMGGRPKIPSNIKGSELAITSDDIFWKKTSPGKTLCVGASYISLETAGFLHAMGYDVDIAVRSILLRGFDRDCADFVGDYMKQIGINFKMGSSPTALEKTDDGRIKVSFKQSNGDDEKAECVYDTVLFATGRAPETKGLGLDKAGVVLDAQSGKIRCSNEQTNVSHIYAIGDIVYGAQELTPVAIQAGRLLARRLFANEKNWMDYHSVPTTVFTPCEYACVGYCEEEAEDVFGEENLEIYHAKNNPLEHYSVKRLNVDGQEMSNTIFFKVICDKKNNEKIVGFHYCGPNAGEVMQGFALAIKVGCTKADLDNLIGIHPTCAEWFTTLKVTKRSGQDMEAENC